MTGADIGDEDNLLEESPLRKIVLIFETTLLSPFFSVAGGASRGELAAAPGVAIILEFGRS